MSKRDSALAAATMEVNRLRVAVGKACLIIESADARNLANDGPAGGCAPQMTLAEWRFLYTTLQKAIR